MKKLSFSGRKTAKANENAPASSVSKATLVSRVAAFVAIPAALVASAAFVGNASYSAFSDTTNNTGNTWSSGTVSLTDDDSGAVMFNAANIAPGATGSNCIKVTSGANLPTTTKLYAANGTQTALNSALNVTITQGTGGSFGSCSGFTADSSGSQLYTGSLSSLISARSSFANGLATSLASGSNKTFKIDYSLPSTVTNTSQGLQGSASFTWESQNN